MRPCVIEVGIQTRGETVQEGRLQGVVVGVCGALQHVDLISAIGRVRNRSLRETTGRVRGRAVAHAPRSAVVVSGVGRLINVRHHRQVTPQVAYISQADYVGAQFLLELQANWTTRPDFSLFATASISVPAATPVPSASFG